MSSNCYNCSNCFQTGFHKSTIGDNNYSYIQLQDFNNNDNNKSISLPAIWPKPPTQVQKKAITSGLQPAPFDLTDYFQDYQFYNASNNSLKKAYPLPNDKCTKSKPNLWTKAEVEKKLKELGLEELMNDRQRCYYNKHNYYHDKYENWMYKLTSSKLTEILNKNYVFKYYDHDQMKDILKYYMCYY